MPVALLLVACGSGKDAASPPGSGPPPGNPPPVVNKPPSAAGMSATTLEGRELTGTLPVATDPDRDAVIYLPMAPPRAGMVVVKENGAFSYWPFTDYVGNDSFGFLVQDARGARSAAYTVNINVTPAGPEPPCIDMDAPSAPTDARKIAFVTGRDGNSEIYTVNEDGVGLTRLTNHPTADEEPQWSPDGRWIAFVSDRTGRSEIHMMSADGNQVVRRSWSGKAHDPAWSADGRSIAYAAVNADGWHSMDIFVVDAACGSPTRVLFDDPGYEAQPAWSPDGNRIAFVSDWHAYDFTYDLFLIEEDGTDFRDFPGYSPFNLDRLFPAWSPDGTRIAIALTERVAIEQYVSSLGVINADGSGLTSLVPTVPWTRHSWSPDGTRIAFTSGTGTARNVSWVAADGSASGLIITNGWNPGWQH